MFCPSGQLKSEQRTEKCELKFCHYFDIFTDVNDLLHSTGECDSTPHCRQYALKSSVFQGSTNNFSHHQILFRRNLECQVVPQEKILSRPGTLYNPAL